jgi:hypothetical protein
MAFHSSVLVFGKPSVALLDALKRLAGVHGRRSDALTSWSLPQPCGKVKSADIAVCAGGNQAVLQTSIWWSLPLVLRAFTGSTRLQFML